MRRGRQGPNFCVLCASDEKSIDHLFIRWPFSVHIWSQLANLLRWNLPNLPSKAYLFWSAWRYISVRKQVRVIWDLSAPAIFGVHVTMDSLKAQHDLSKLSKAALLPFLIGSFYFQTEQGI